METLEIATLVRAQGHRERGEALREAGRLPEAIAELREAVRLVASIEARAALSRALLDEGRTEEALAEYRTAARSDTWGSRDELMLDLGRAIERAGGMEEALAGFRELVTAAGDTRLPSLLLLDPVATFLSLQPTRRRRRLSEQFLEELLSGHFRPPHVFSVLPSSAEELYLQLQTDEGLFIEAEDNPKRFRHRMEVVFCFLDLCRRAGLIALTEADISAACFRTTQPPRLRYCSRYTAPPEA